MKKSLVGTIALGLIIGAGALSTNAFANEKQINNQNQTQVYSSNQFEQLDDSTYSNPSPESNSESNPNYNYNYGQGCGRGNRRGCGNGYYRNNNRQQNQEQTNENLNFNIQ